MEFGPDMEAQIKMKGIQSKEKRKKTVTIKKEKEKEKRRVMKITTAYYFESTSRKSDISRNVNLKFQPPSSQIAELVKRNFRLWLE